MGLIDEVRGRLARRRDARAERQAERLMAEARAHADQRRYAEALAIWEPLARAGVPRAQNNIGACFANGHGVEADLELAARWITPAAEAGDPVAQRNLATLHAQGLGVAEDAGEAVRWYRAAAEQGDAVSQDMLAWMLTDGAWMPPDDALALRWTQAAAEAGIARAQARLGRMYHEARGGLPRDPAAAVAWWRRAALQNEPEAQAMLGAAYHMGRGTPPDPVEALHWLLRAQRGGSPLTGNFVGPARAAVDEAGRAEAERRATQPLEAASP